MESKNWVKDLLLNSRLAHLATSTKDGVPHVVPICYAYDGNSIYTPIDEKPKHVGPDRLRRVLNILHNPHVSFVVDLYDEDWSKLRFIKAGGIAEILREGEQHERAISLLREKYRQYRSMNLEKRPIIRIELLRVSSWSAAPH